MKKYPTISLFCVISVAMVTLLFHMHTTHAQNATTTEETALASTTDPTTSTPTPEELEVFTKELENHRTSLQKKKQERVYNLLENIIGRMNAVIYRFDSIADRIESRAHIRESQGMSSENTLREVTRARTELSLATAILSSDLGSFAWSEKPRERFVEVRTQIQQAKQHLYEARIALGTALDTLNIETTQTTASSTDLHAI